MPLMVFSDGSSKVCCYTRALKLYLFFRVQFFYFVRRLFPLNYTTADFKNSFLRVFKLRSFVIRRKYCFRVAEKRCLFYFWRLEIILKRPLKFSSRTLRSRADYHRLFFDSNACGFWTTNYTEQVVVLTVSCPNHTTRLMYVDRLTPQTSWVHFIVE